MWITWRRVGYGNIAPVADCSDFTFIEVDVIHEIDIEGSLSLAPPLAYPDLPVATLMCGSVYTFNLLRLAQRKGAHLIIAFTS